jgi:hypothetical protein
MACLRIRQGGITLPASVFDKCEAPNTGDVPTKFRCRKAGFTPGKSPFRNIRNIRNFLRGWGATSNNTTCFPPKAGPSGLPAGHCSGWPGLSDGSSCLFFYPGRQVNWLSPVFHPHQMRMVHAELTALSVVSTAGHLAPPDDVPNVPNVPTASSDRA